MPAPRQDKGKLRTEPSVNHAAVTLGTAFEECRALYIGTGGDATITVNGVALLYRNLPAGCVLPVQATLVANGASAADIVALY